jgi:hypothetical protein
MLNRGDIEREGPMLLSLFSLRRDSGRKVQWTRTAKSGFNQIRANFPLGAGDRQNENEDDQHRRRRE